ncbi:putative transporter [Exophiala dermatitidis]
MAEKESQSIHAEMVDEAALPVADKGELVQLDAAAEKALVRKIDLHLLPPLFVLYMCAFIDRVNIGNARIQGLEKDLNMTGSDYNIALFMFFIPYITLEFPSNVLLKRLRPSIYLPSLIIGWGIMTVCQGVTGSFAGLVVCRVLIGVFEAGFFPGMVYLVSMYYKRNELQWRLNILWSAAIISGAFSGLLAYGLANMDGIAGYGGWRWIFIIEGIATVLIAAAAIFVLPDWPTTARFLSQSERTLLEQRLGLDTGDRCRMDRWGKGTAARVFGDIKIWLGVLMFLGVTTTNYAFAFFTPTILKQLGWTSVRSQVMSIPIWVAAALAALGAAWFSDRMKHRYGFIVLGAAITTIGYAILLAMHSVPVGARYFALYTIVMGGYITQPITIGWLNNNLSGHYKRAAGTALSVGLGNVSGIIGSTVFLTREAPTYPTGFGVGLGLCWVTVAAATVLAWYIIRENRIRDNGGRDYRYELPEDEKGNLGDDHPSFRFML